MCNIVILFILCVGSCIGANLRGALLRENYMFDGEDTFRSTAHGSNPVTDKVTPLTVINNSSDQHSYETMYGTILLPMVEKFQHKRKPLKFLEIGLGCNMVYGPGASAKLWQQIFENRNVDVWEAEFDEKCVDKYRSEGKLEGIKTLTGDQGNATVVDRWIKESGGKFDVIVDDGGHVNKQVLTSFASLWPELNPDGNYFIEDLHVAYRVRDYHHYNVAGVPPVTKVVQSWVEALHVGSDHVSGHHKHILAMYPLPAGLDSIYCQTEACVLHKAPNRPQAAVATPLL